MRIFIREIMDDIAKLFGYVPKTLIQDKLNEVNKESAVLMTNMSMFQKQAQAITEKLDRSRITTIQAVVKTDRQGIYRYQYEIYAIGYELANHMGSPNLKTGDIVIKQPFTFLLTEGIIIDDRNVAIEYTKKLARLLNVEDSYDIGSFEKEIIIGSATQVDGLTYWLPRPARHHHVHELMRKYGIEYLGKEIQGFYTSYNRFVNRQDALEIATNAEQLLERHQHKTDLFSESVW